MIRVWSLLLLLVVGCAPSTPFRAPPLEPVALLPATERSISVTAQGARPGIEIDGRGTEGYGWPYIVPLLVVDVYGWVSEWRGPVVSPHLDEELVPTRIQADLVNHLRATKAFSEVSEAGGDYQLDVEVLHLSASFHERGKGHQVVIFIYGGVYIIPIYAGWFAQEDTLPHGTAALRMRLSREGRLIAERTISNSVVLPPRPDEELQEALIRTANRVLRGALAKTRAQVVSWVQADESRNVSRKDAWAKVGAQLVKSPSFLLARTNPHRLGTTFAEVSYPSGKVLKTWQADGIPSLSTPEEWLLSPVTSEGVWIPRPYYAALADRLSRRFLLRRTDELSTYRYYGPKKR